MTQYMVSKSVVINDGL